MRLSSLAIAVILFVSVISQLVTVYGEESVDFALDRVIVKYKTPKTPLVDDYPMTECESEIGGVAISSARIINPTPLDSLSDISITKPGNQNKLAVITISDPGVANINSLIKALKSDDDVEYVERDYTYKTCSTVPNDVFYEGEQKIAMELISASEAWSLSTGDAQVTVGIIDTGIQIDHPDLINNIWQNLNKDQDGYQGDQNGFDFLNRSGEVVDLSGHGTMVAGIIGAEGNNKDGIAGINWNISMASLTAFDQYGNGRASDIIEALNYASNHGMLITNNSYSGNNYSRALQETIGDGGLFVVAAGNDYKNLDISPSYPASYNLDNMIAVAATDNQDYLTSFTNSGLAVDLAAPSIDVYSTTPTSNYGIASGTSVSAAFVTGVCALVLSGLDAAEPDVIAMVKSRVLESSDPLTQLRGRLGAGGRLNAYYAVDATKKHDVSEVKLDQETVQLDIHESVTLTAEVYPLEYDQAVEWTSNAPNIAEVNQDGEVVGMSSGEAVITARSMRDKSKSVDCAVTVTNNEIPAIEFDDADFKEAVKKLLSAIDPQYNEREQLYPYDAMKLERMEVKGLGITSVKGLEYFKNVKYLNLDSNNIESIDLSNLKQLKEAVLSRNALTTLKAENLENLTSLECMANRITELTLTNLPALGVLMCHYNQLTTLDITGAPNLLRVDLRKNELTELIADKDINKNLWLLLASDNKFETIDLSVLTALATIDISNNELIELDISENSSIDSVAAYNNKLERVITEPGSELRYLYIGGNNLTELDTSELYELLALDCSSNLLKSLDVFDNWLLSHLYCANNELEELLIDVTNAWSSNLGAGMIQCSGNYLDLDGTELSAQFAQLVKEGVQIDEVPQRKLPPPPEQIILGVPSELIVELGETLELAVSITPADALQEYILYSSEETVATVTDGIITAVGVGDTTITVRAKADPSVVEEIQLRVIEKSTLYIELSSGEGIVFADGKFSVPLKISGINDVSKTVEYSGGLSYIEFDLDYSDVFDLDFVSDVAQWDGEKVYSDTPITQDGELGVFEFKPNDSYQRDNYEITLNNEAIYFVDEENTPNEVTQPFADVAVRKVAYILGKSLKPPTFDPTYPLTHTVKEGDTLPVPTATTDNGEPATVFSDPKAKIITVNTAVGKYTVRYIAEDPLAPGLRAYLELTCHVVERLDAPILVGSTNGSRLLTANTLSDEKYDDNFTLTIERSIDGGYTWLPDTTVDSLPFTQRMAVSQTAKASRPDFMYRAYTQVIYKGKSYKSGLSNVVSVKRHAMQPVLELTGEPVDNYYFSQIYSELGIGAQAKDAVTGQILETSRITKSFIEKRVAGARRKLAEGQAVPSPTNLDDPAEYITEYNVLYTITDDCGNTSNATRRVSVRGELGDLTPPGNSMGDHTRDTADYYILRNYVLLGLRNLKTPGFGFEGTEDIYRANLSGNVWAVNRLIEPVYRITLEDVILLKETTLGRMEFDISRILANINEKRMSQAQKEWRTQITPN